VEKKERYYTGNLKKYLSAKKLLPRHKECGRFNITRISDKRQNKVASGFVLQNILLKLYSLRFSRKTSESDIRFTDTDLPLRFVFMPSVCNVGYYSNKQTPWP
jgi:hypothetical protein